MPPRSTAAATLAGQQQTSAALAGDPAPAPAAAVPPVRPKITLKIPLPPSGHPAASAGATHNRIVLTGLTPLQPVLLLFKRGNVHVFRVKLDELPVSNPAPADEEEEEEEQEEEDDLDEGDADADQLLDLDQDEDAGIVDLELDEEGQWLVDMQMGDSVALTARQKALRDGSGQQLLALPLKNSRRRAGAPAATADQGKIKERAEKRRLKEQQRSAELMETTIQSLLKNKPTRKLAEDEGKLIQDRLRVRVTGPHMHTHITREGTTISLTPGLSFPLQAAAPLAHPPPRPVCEAHGCGKPRRYADAATHRSVCSLVCLRTLTAPSV